MMTGSLQFIHFKSCIDLQPEKNVNVRHHQRAKGCALGAIARQTEMISPGAKAPTRYRRHLSIDCAREGISQINE